jgi:hypothetical protein
MNPSSILIKNFTQQKYSSDSEFSKLLTSFIKTKYIYNNKLYMNHTCITGVNGKLSLFNNYNRSTTIFASKQYYYKVIKRTMMLGGRVLNHVARTAYYTASTLTNDDWIHSISKNSHQPLVNNIVEMSLDSFQGIPQHKTKLVKSIINHQFPSEQVHQSFQEYLLKNTEINPLIVKNEPHTLVDCRFMNELPAVKELLSRYYKDIDWLLLTNDARPANFPHQHQPNQDFWVMVKTKMDNAMGLGYKCVNHDEKSGMDMFHSTRGTLGILTYEQNGVLVPFTKAPINLTDHNSGSIKNIRSVYNTKNNYPIIDEQLLKYKLQFENLLKNTNNNLITLQEQYQKFLWESFQLNPNNERSISLIFAKEVLYQPFSEKQERFANHFKSLLADKVYDLDQRGDCQQIYKAMLIAYKENVDANIIKKLHYLNKDIDIEFNVHFLHYTAKWIKDGLL